MKFVVREDVLSEFIFSSPRGIIFQPARVKVVAEAKLEERLWGCGKYDGGSNKSLGLPRKRRGEEIVRSG